MEHWDLYDENRTLTGRTMARGETQPPNTYYNGVEIWIASSSGELLLTLRSPEKNAYPNTWETPGGCVLAGETSRQGAVRELREETGIVAAEDELVLLGTVRDHREFCDTYLLHSDVAAGDVVLQPGETALAKWVTLEALEALMQTDDFARPVAERLAAVREAFDRAR